MKEGITLKSSSFKELPLICEQTLKALKKLDNSVIAITGAAGLIGTYCIYIIDYYNNNFGGNIKVVAIDRNAEEVRNRFSECLKKDYFSYIIGDVNDPDFTKSILNDPIDYLIHAASNTSPIEYAKDPVGTIATNTIATYNLLDFSVKNNVKRFMFCSSVEKYGANRGDVDDFDEEYCGYLNSNIPRSAYPSGKIAAESMCASYKAQYDLDYVISRIGRIYGPTVILSDTKAPTQFIMNAVRGENIVLKSDGMQLFSYCYVGDCASAIFYILANGESSEAYNIADPNSKIRLKEFASFAAKAGNTECIFEKQTSLEMSGYSKITKATMNTDKLISIGWKPSINIENGIKLTVDYLKENYDVKA